MRLRHCPCPGNADALPIARSGLDADFERLGVRNRAFAVTGRTRRQILAGAVAARTLDVELHASAGLGDLPGAIALGTFAGSLERSLTVALRADILPRDVEAHDAAADRRPEGNVDLIFEIGAGLGAFFGRSAPRPPPKMRTEDVAKTASATGSLFCPRPAVVHQVGKIESAEVEGNAALASGWAPPGKPPGNPPPPELPARA